MKRLLIITGLLCSALVGNAQSQEIQQLALNIEKLTQLKKILNNMYEGYQTVSKGYNTIKDISQGNFNLHQVFLDKLLQVSPSVRNYKRVADIIGYQSQIVKEYKAAFNRFKASNLFNTTEVNYMDGIYTDLFSKSLQNLDEMAMVITAGKLRMSDDERMAAIDRIYNDMGEKLSFLRSFNKGTNILAVQRGRESLDIKVSKQLNGLP